MYCDSDETGGRPHYDEVLIIKMLILAGWHGLSDYEVGFLAHDRLLFRHFLVYSEKIPDRSTVWMFRERLTENGKKIHQICNELQRQLEEKGYSLKRGVIQDASFTTSSPGHASAEKPRGDAARTRRSRDGIWAKKGSKSEFGIYFIH